MEFLDERGESVWQRKERRTPMGLPPTCSTLDYWVIGSSFHHGKPRIQHPQCLIELLEWGLLKHLQLWSVCDPAKLFLTSKFSPCSVIGRFKFSQLLSCTRTKNNSSRTNITYNLIFCRTEEHVEPCCMVLCRTKQGWKTCARRQEKHAPG